MIKVYFHIAVMGDWMRSYKLIQPYLAQSELNDILYCVCGDVHEASKHIDSQNILWLSDSINNFEFPTLNFMLNDAQEDDRILYIHTKGASTGINEPIRDWIDTMCWFNITENQKCITLLNEYDALGVDFHEEPFKHFSGNFWWSKGSHIKKLQPLVNVDRHAAERWIASVNGRYVSLHNTGINVYQRHLHLYPKTNYRQTI